MTQAQNPQHTKAHEPAWFAPEAEAEAAWVAKLQQSLSELTPEDMASIASYSTDTAYALGKQDFQAGCSPRSNPFPQEFMRGVPHTSFASYYAHGRQVAEAIGQANRARHKLTQAERPWMMAA